jgi:hypothetical protein
MIKTSESIDKLAAALVKAQKNIGAAIKDSANPFFKSKYADLGSVMEACKEALNAQGIAVTQPIHFDENGYYVTTTFLHETGQFISSTIKLMMKNPDMQQMGAAASYARRYGLQSMGFIPAEDDDGELVVRPQRPTPPPQGPRPTPPQGRPPSWGEASNAPSGFGQLLR